MGVVDVDVLRVVVYRSDGYLSEYIAFEHCVALECLMCRWLEDAQVSDVIKT